MGTIIIDRLKVYANHGVFAFENEQGQNFYISCKMNLREGNRASDSDSIDDTVSYATVCEFIVNYMKSNTFHLIETVGDGLVREILEHFHGIEECTIRVDKPEAPIALEFESVAYEITRKWNIAAIAIGSNLGDKKAYLETAISSISNDRGIHLLSKSNLIETEPYGGVAQDSFLNGCLLIETYYSAQELLEVLHHFEQDAHRTREIHWGPRTLDLDIILYNEEIIHTKDLIIPHIDMQNREFVLKPLCEIAPYAYHPILKKTVTELYSALQSKAEE